MFQNLPTAQSNLLKDCCSTCFWLVRIMLEIGRGLFSPADIPRANFSRGLKSYISRWKRLSTWPEAQVHGAFAHPSCKHLDLQMWVALGPQKRTYRDPGDPNSRPTWQHNGRMDFMPSSQALASRRSFKRDPTWDNMMGRFIYCHLSQALAWKSRLWTG